MPRWRQEVAPGHFGSRRRLNAESNSRSGCHSDLDALTRICHKRLYDYWTFAWIFAVTDGMIGVVQRCGAALWPGLAAVMLVGACTVEKPTCDSDDRCRSNRVCHEGQCLYPDQVQDVSSSEQSDTSDTSDASKEVD